jgi:hypothetical protein
MKFSINQERRACDKEKYNSTRRNGPKDYLLPLVTTGLLEIRASSFLESSSHLCTVYEISEITRCGRGLAYPHRGSGRPPHRSAPGQHGWRTNPRSTAGPLPPPSSPRCRQRRLLGKPASSPRTVAAGISLLRPRRGWDLGGGGLLRRGDIGSAASDVRGCGPAPTAVGTTQSW